MKIVSRVSMVVLLVTAIFSLQAKAEWVYAGKFVCTEPGQCRAACMDLQAIDWDFQDPYDTSGVVCECRCNVPGNSLVSNLKYTPAANNKPLLHLARNYGFWYAR